MKEAKKWEKIHGKYKLDKINEENYSENSW